MPRDSAGTYTLPASNPVVTGTPIQSAGWANPTMADIGNEITNSLDRAGRGGMTGPFGIANGTLAGPGLRFTSDPDNGIRLTGINTYTLVAAAQDIVQVDVAGITMLAGKTASNFGASVDQSDVTPIDFVKGDLWFESDTGAFYLSYTNPDLTSTIVGLTGVGGNFVPASSVGAANGVAGLDSFAHVPTVQGGVPTGAMFDFGGTAAPLGYLLCDGTSYATAAQFALFSAIGYTWGGAGANFNVPDFRRKVAVGSGGTGTPTLGNVVSNVGGQEAHVQTVAELAAHVHVQQAGDLMAPLAAAGTGAGGRSSDGTATVNGPSTNSNGSSTAFNIMQPSAVVTKIIKT